MKFARTVLVLFSVSGAIADEGTCAADSPQAHDAHLRGAAVYLITYSNNPDEQMMDFFPDLIQSIVCLWKHYLRQHGHALLIFHAGDRHMPDEHQQQIRIALPASAEIKFIRVDFDFPRIIAGNSSFMDAECGEDWARYRRCGCTCAGGCYWRLK